jgi:hypothetical protein
VVIFMCVRGIYLTSSQESEWSYLCVLGVFILPQARKVSGHIYVC